MPRSHHAPRLATERLSLEPLSPDDAEAMAEILADSALYDFTGGEAPSVDELRALYRRWQAGSGSAAETWHNWVLRSLEDGVPVGHLQATVWPSRRAAEVAWVLGVAWQGRGFASEGAQAVIGWLESSGVVTVTAHIRPGHRASERVAERVGMQPTPEIEDGERVWRWASRNIDGRAFR